MPKRAADHIITDLTSLALDRAATAFTDVANLLDHPQDRFELAMNLAVNVVLYATESDRKLREASGMPRLDLHRTARLILANVHRSIEALPRGYDVRTEEIQTLRVKFER